MRYSLRCVYTCAYAYAYASNITSRIAQCGMHSGRKRCARVRVRVMHSAAMILVGVFLVALGFFPHRALAARYSEPILFRIGLASNLGEVTLELSGGETLLDLSAKEPRTLPLPGDHLIFIQSGGHLFCDGIPLGTGPVLLLPSPNGSFLTWNGRSYRGGFIITPQVSGITLVNLLHMEEYLRGVVPREAIPGWPLAALKAQAIAARTYGIVSLKRHIR